MGERHSLPVQAVFGRVAAARRAAAGERRSRSLEADPRAADPPSLHTDSSRPATRNGGGRPELRVAQEAKAQADCQANHPDPGAAPAEARSPAAPKQLAAEVANPLHPQAVVGEPAVRRQGPNQQRRPMRRATALRTTGRTCWTVGWRRRTWRTGSSRDSQAQHRRYFDREQAQRAPNFRGPSAESISGARSREPMKTAGRATSKAKFDAPSDAKCLLWRANSRARWTDGHGEALS